MDWIKRRSFKQSIFISLITVSLIPLIICSVFLVKIYNMTIEYQSEKDSSQQIVQLTNKMTTLFDSQIKASHFLSKDDLSAIVLVDNKTIEYPKELYYNLYNLQVSMQVQSSFTIYDASGYQRFSTDSLGELQRSPLYWGIINKLRNGHSTAFYAVEPLLNPQSKTIIQTGFPIDNAKGVRFGYVIMGLNKQSLDSLFEGFYSPKDTLIITDQHMNLIYSTNSKDAPTIIDNFNTNTFEPGYSYASQIEPHSNFNLLLRKSTPLPTNTIRSMYQISFIIALICLILCILISLKIGKSLTKPIRKLNDAMDQVKNGDLTIQINTNRQDELGNLTSNFNRMTTELKEFVYQQIKAEQKLNDTKLQLFQTQLNPHFLANTLDSIRWNAKIHHIQDIASMSENLATILRETISGSQLTTLKEELKLVENYIEIQKVRFSNMFSYEAEIPLQLEDCIVPKLLLQPIVENAIIHGIADKETGRVQVYADQIGPNIHINVTDDGIGMSSDIRNWLNSDYIEKKEGHLGLYNLDNIIKMYYGHEYGLKAIVEKGIGTTITVILPINKGGSDD